MIKYLENVITLLESTIKNYVFDNTIPQQFFMMTLLCTIYENCTSSMILLKKNMYTAVTVLFRNILEAHIDLINIIQDENYYKDMAVSYLKERNKILKSACDKKENRFIEELKNIEDICKKYQESKDEFDDLINDGAKVLTIIEKFEKAESEDLYLSIYNLLCQETHNNVISLSSRHFNEDTLGVEIFKKIDESKILPYVDSMMGVLVKSCELISNLLDTEYDKNLNIAKEILEHFRKSY